jgi:hypothetical protein
MADLSDDVSLNRKIDVGSSIQTYLVAWSTGFKIFFGLIMTAFVVPIVIILTCIPFEELPQSMLSFTAGITTASFFVLILVLLVAPYRIILEDGACLKVKTILRLTICACKMKNIKSVSPITFRDYCRIRTVGFPTKWRHVLAIHTDNGYAIIVSPQDPDTFINDLSYYVV